MSDPQQSNLDGLDNGEPHNGGVGDQVWVEGTPQDEWRYRTSRECWMADDAVLELLAVSSEWAAWTTNPSQLPHGSGLPADIFGEGRRLYRQPHPTRWDMQLGYLENQGGGVPIEVIKALIRAAETVGTRARAIASLAANIAVLECDLGHQVSRKPLREAIWFWWNVPRFSPLGRVRSKYPLTLRWSPAAWAASTDRSAQLVLEHVTPLNIHVDRLIVANGDEQETRSILHSIDLVVITKDEDRLVTHSKWGTKIPDNGTDGYERYRAAGLQPDTFIIPANIPKPPPVEP